MQQLDCSDARLLLLSLRLVLKHLFAEASGTF